jgi:hypothetical protein
MKGSAWWRDEVPPELGDGYIRAIIRALRDGGAWLQWTEITHGDLTFEICNPRKRWT